VTINLAKGVSNELYLITVLEPEENLLEESYEPAGVSALKMRVFHLHPSFPTNA